MRRGVLPSEVFCEFVHFFVKYKAVMTVFYLISDSRINEKIRAERENGRRKLKILRNY